MPVRKTPEKYFNQRTSDFYSNCVARGKKLGLPEAAFTLPQIREWVAACLRDKSLCPYCKKKLTLKTISLDHILPLSRKGQNQMSNLQLVCRGCNRLKGQLTHTELYILLDFLKHRLPPEMATDVRARLKAGACRFFGSKKRLTG